MQNFIIRKNIFKKADNQPDFRITYKDEDGEWKEWGACFWRKDKNGNWYQSCVKSKPREQQTDDVKLPPF